MTKLERSKAVKRWRETIRLLELARENTPTGLIAHRLGRTKGAVRSLASRRKVSLKPINRSPRTYRTAQEIRNHHREVDALIARINKLIKE